MEEARVTFYRVSNCGYYPYGGAQRPPLFGDLSSTVEHLHTWSSGLPHLSHTRTHSTSRNGDALPAYLVNVTQGSSGWLVTLWNESPTTDGRVVAIDGTAPIGSAEVSENEVEQGFIPGHATYFWVLPQDNLVATVRLRHALAGTYSFGKYLHGFLANFGPHVVRGGQAPSPSQLPPVVGYRVTAGQALAKVRPAFKFNIFRKAGPLGFLQANAARIRKIHKKDVLDIYQPPNLAVWQQALSTMHLRNYTGNRHLVGLDLALEVAGLTQQELQDVVDGWHAEDDSNYGFTLQGDPKPYWLNSATASDALPFDLVRDNVEVVNADSLLSELHRNRVHLLSLLN